MRIPTRRTCSVRTALLTRDSNPKSIKITTPTGPCFGLVGVCAVFMPYFPAGAVGVAARPVRRISYAEMAKRKASPGGEAGATSVATDEVEAKNYHHGMVRRGYLRPHPVRLEPDHLPLQGKAFLCPGRFCVNFYRSNVAVWRAGHAAAPTKPRREASRTGEITPPQSHLTV